MSAALAPTMMPPAPERAAAAPSPALDRFLAHYYARRPVNATFTGVHAYDHQLPDWSPDGLAALDDEMRRLHAELSAAHPAPAPKARGGAMRALRADVRLLDAELARAYLEIQRAELASGHGPRGNPALWTGEAIFGLVSLMRPGADGDGTAGDAPFEAAAARLEGVPGFFAAAEATLGARALPTPWTARALRECAAAAVLLESGIERWLDAGLAEPALAARLRTSAARAAEAFVRFGVWLHARPAAAPGDMACGSALYDLLLARGHWCARPAAELLLEARALLAGARGRLAEMAGAAGGSWEEVQARLADDHPTPDEYLDAFARTWAACHETAEALDLVTWPEWPIRYVAYPAWTRDVAPALYYLHYRAPAPFDPYTEHDYLVPPLPGGDPTAHLRAWNHATIKLNHVVHHGGIGHHVQNWHAYHRAPSRIGQIAAVDTASRIGMFCGGTMAEGWACYATALMEEVGFLTPLERVSEAHARVRFLARAVVDLALHRGEMAFDEAARFWMEQVGTGPDAAAAEVTRASMFPGTAVMYWLGTQGILDLRDQLRRRDGPDFSLREFHDALLAHGSIPVPLVARLMTEELP